MEKHVQPCAFLPGILRKCMDMPYLVGGFNPSEKYESVSWDDEIPNMWKNKIDVPNQPIPGSEAEWLIWA